MLFNLINKLFGVIVLILIAFLLMNSFFVTKSGYIYHEQDLIMERVLIHSEPMIHFRIPFAFYLTQYTKAWTVTFGTAYGGEQVRRKAPIRVSFADTYTADIPATFRYKLSDDEAKMKMIHDDFRTFEDLVDSLLIKISRDVAVNTATQYTGEEFFQGGLNQFKAALTDQLKNGIYETRREQVSIEQTGIAPVGIDQEQSNQLQTVKTLVWKTIPVMKDGELVRLENPLDKYGIELIQVSIGEPREEKQLQTLLAEKKRLVGDRIKAVQAQETAREQAKTAQLRVEIERTEARQLALKDKDLAVIAKQREVEVAMKQQEKEIVEYNKDKELAEIEKSKELAIAQADQKIEQAIKDKDLIVAQAGRDIQKANYEAAQFEAKAIREKGIAEAEVLKAKYKALIPEIYLAEMQKEIAAIIYPNLKGINVTMPHNIVSLDGSGAKLQTNLDVLSSFATISVMDKLEQKGLEEVVVE
ncbi:SPFH domain-containing protein [Candidatus Halobeggiatoa sp. HSG11]|nr:SPFH domain-containing protein [Candidatus Halobeggiatoa sp. HSG11]